MFPSTHLSLLAAITGDSSNRLPWERFVTIYEPALRRWLTKRGLSPHDAEDCTQQVLMSVSRSIRSFRDDNQPASLRRWIHPPFRAPNADAVVKRLIEESPRPLSAVQRTSRAKTKRRKKLLHRN